MRGLLKAFNQIEKMVKRFSANSDSESTAEPIFHQLYEELSTCSEFAHTFPNAAVFFDITRKLETAAQDIIQKRMAFYDKDASKLSSSLQSFLGKLPAASMEDLSSYLQKSKAVEKDLVKLSDSTKKLLLSVERDCVDFACSEDSICSRVKENLLLLVLLVLLVYIVSQSVVSPDSFICYDCCWLWLMTIVYY